MKFEHASYVSANNYPDSVSISMIDPSQFVT